MVSVRAYSRCQLIRPTRAPLPHPHLPTRRLSTQPPHTRTHAHHHHETTHTHTPSDGCYISKGYDATTHFESTVDDVLDLYKRITGKDIDLNSKDPRLAAAAQE